jgi:hypothetical protein
MNWRSYKAYELGWGRTGELVGFMCVYAPCPTNRQSPLNLRKRQLHRCRPCQQKQRCYNGGRRKEPVLNACLDIYLGILAWEQGLRAGAAGTPL